MHGYLAKADRPTSGGGAQRSEAHVAGRAGADAGPPNAISGKTASLLQLKQALDRSASVQSQLELQRALDRRWAGPEQSEASPQREFAPPQRKPNATGLPDGLKAGVEHLSGLAMDDVRVHYNSARPARLQAWAYTHGTDIHVGPGQEQHLPHEAWHVVQQKQGRVKPTLQMKGVAINDDSLFETEADAMGAQAARLMPRGNARVQDTTVAGPPVVQAKWIVRDGKLVEVPDDYEMQGGEAPFQSLRLHPAAQDFIDHARADQNPGPVPPTVTGGATAPTGLSLQSDISSSSNTAPAGFATQPALNPESEVKEREVKHHENINYVGNPNVSSIPAGAVGVKHHASTSATMPPALSVAGKPVLSSGSFLQDFKPQGDVDAWSHGHPELTAAHHKFPKSALAWLSERMQSRKDEEDKKSDRQVLREKLHLPADAGGKAVARLRSNLISPKYKGLTVKSDSRLDDPHNNATSSEEGEEGLDLVRDESGNLTPRSDQYRKLKDVAAGIHARWSAGGKNKDFKLDAKEAADVTGHLRAAEELHYAIEGQNARLPSHSSGDVWTDSVEPKNVDKKDEPQGASQQAAPKVPKFRKKPVPPIQVDTKAAAEQYDAEKEKELKDEEQKRRQELEEARMKKAAAKDEQRDASRRGFGRGHSAFW
jgi:hypothetical protein